MVKIKICGVQSESDVTKINQVHPDLIGFVFAPSKRQITLDTGKKLRQQLNPEIVSVGVYVDQDTAMIEAALGQQVINQVQYYGQLPDDLIDMIHGLNGELIQVVTDKQQIDSEADYVMFDSSRGRGLAPREFVPHDLAKPEYLSGGINLENVKDAVETIKPEVVDVSSSTGTDGQKDLKKMETLTEAVHEL